MNSTNDMPSHSTRVRGLKSYRSSATSHTVLVALYTSAWIEIIISRNQAMNLKVALYTSAWIEISQELATSSKPMSHSTRVRGLKFDELEQSNQKPLSHSTRVRGLKLILSIPPAMAVWSHSTRVRGLKLLLKLPLLKIF